jgi:hypothetical protein
MLCASWYVGAPCFLGIGNCTPEHGIIQTHLDNDSRELGSTLPVFNHQLGQIRRKTRQLLLEDLVLLRAFFENQTVRCRGAIGQDANLIVRRMSPSTPMELKFLSTAYVSADCKHLGVIAKSVIMHPSNVACRGPNSVFAGAIFGCIIPAPLVIPAIRYSRPPKYECPCSKFGKRVRRHECYGCILPG